MSPVNRKFQKQIGGESQRETEKSRAWRETIKGFKLENMTIENNREGERDGKREVGDGR